MTGPSRFQLGQLAYTPLDPRVQVAARAEHGGRLLVWPAALGEAEIAAAIDALVLLTRWPVTWSSGEVGPGVVRLGLAESAALGREQCAVVVRDLPGDGGWRVPQSLRRLMEGVLDAVGLQQGLGPMARAARLARLVVDTPETAQRFLAGAGAALVHGAPPPDDDHLLAAGLAEVLRVALGRLSPALACWALAFATDPTLPALRVGELGRGIAEPEAARALRDAGLALWAAADGARQPPVLRSSLAAIGDLRARAGGRFGALLLEALDGGLPSEVLEPLRRAVTPPPPLVLPSPRLSGALIGRDGELDRLEALLTPLDHVRLAVLVGDLGSGRRAVAAALADRLSPRLEPVWLRFGGDPAAAWRTVAGALRVDVAGSREPRGSDAQRAWLAGLFDRLRAHAALLIIEDVEQVPEAELADWLPAGPGRLGLLLLSARPEAALCRARDGVAVVLPLLSPALARDVLADRAPRLMFQIEAGELDYLLTLLGGQAGAVAMAGEALARHSLEALVARLEASPGPVVGALAGLVLEELEEAERDLVGALVVGPESGSWARAALAVAGQQDGAALDKLVARGLVMSDGEQVRLGPLLRLCGATSLDPARLDVLRDAHTTGCCDTFAQLVREGHDGFLALLADDFSLALGRLMEQSAPGQVARVAVVAEAVLQLGGRARRWLVGASAAIDRISSQGLTADQIRGMHRLGVRLLNHRVKFGEPERWADAIARARSLQAELAEAQHAMEVDATLLLAEALLASVGEDLPARQAEARALLEAKLEHLGPDEQLRGVAKVQAVNLYGMLGAALTAVHGPERPEALRRAVTCFERALAGIPIETQLERWASLQSNLAAVLTSLAVYEPARLSDSLLAGAIAAALTLSDRGVTASQAWSNLVVTLRRWPRDRGQYALKLALEHSLKAAELTGPYSDPMMWVDVRLNVAQTLVELPEDDPVGRAELAAQLCEEALSQMPPLVAARRRGRVCLSLGRAQFVRLLNDVSGAAELAEQALREAIRQLDAQEDEGFSAADARHWLVKTLLVDGSRRDWELGRVQEIVGLCQDALRVLPPTAPSHLDLRNDLGAALSLLARFQAGSAQAPLDAWLELLRTPPELRNLESWRHAGSNALAALQALDGPERDGAARQLGAALQDALAGLPVDAPTDLRRSVRKIVEDLLAQVTRDPELGP